MTVIFNIRVSQNLNNVEVKVHRNGAAHTYTLSSSKFMASFENDDIYDHLVEWFGSNLLPEFDSDVYDNIANVYMFLKNPNASADSQNKRGIAARLFIGLAKPSIIPQALIPHRVSPFADTERAWAMFSQTKPFIDNARREEGRMQELQSSLESTMLQSESAKAYPSQFEALMHFRGVSRAHVRRSFFVNLLLALIFILVAFAQAFLILLVVLGKETSLFHLPVINVFEYVAWPLSLMMFSFSLLMGLGRLWYCTLINERKLESEFTFFQFLKSGKYYPGDFKRFEEE